MNLTKPLLILASLTLLSGCFESRKNTEKLCADNPNLRCEQLNMDDGQCRIPRTDLIWHRFEILKSPSDDKIIKEYSLVSAYRKCLELASQIQAIDQTKLKENRFNALVNMGKEQERIATQLKQSNSPEALYFLWSQIGDNSARRAFLQLEGKPELETAEMQYALATFYTDRDKPKTIELLHKSLELGNGKPLNTELLKALASNYHALHDKEHAYLWAMVGKEFGVPVASSTEMKRLYGFSPEKFAALDEAAASIVKAIRNGSYTKTLLPKPNEG
ncbi:DUF2989 domain-containing protein [Vibrio mimicus]|uniref:DUF2989 domain-containing protein n=1 Tax=Vibrio mimicus TaxID=674 RepID=UPI0002BAD73C|nr:DUF2989 domain-containing protein [Vibrio mimicus]EMB50928.1 hypothetical protein D908_06478 [Vibrio mimicus CAIM 602]MBY7674361.1 DUF2989 domain-containing protein [Vibrio mimicus]MBY7726221.1 DUF2989 domain-containing protein [Vibrio mimicus]TXY32275.1 DUF2989 domain-containing protein [Vibrio mimicus]